MLNVQKLPLSLVIITKNEEKNIEDCLRSASFVSDIVVVDSGSTDRTAEIAEKLGARFIQKDWLGFGAQKKFATEQAKFDWVLNLDADERVTPELAQEIFQKWDELRPEVGYQISRRSFHLGRWILHGGWHPDYQLRLFHRKHSQWDVAQIHEKVISSSRERLSASLEHFVFRNLHHQIETNNRYSLLQAEALFKKGKKFSLWRLVFKPWSKFLETYFWKLGFLDGLPGFIIAVGAAYSVFLKWAKLWEIERRQV